MAVYAGKVSKYHIIVPSVGLFFYFKRGLYYKDALLVFLLVR